MARKSNATRKDGRIAVQIYLGNIDGKRKYKTVYGKTQKEANTKADAIREKLNKGIDFTSNESLKFWIDKWLYLKKQTVSHSTYISYTYCIKYFEPLYNIQMNKISIADIKEILYSAQNKNVSFSQLKKLKISISQVFKLAIENRTIDFNPVEFIKIQSLSPPERRRALTPEEQQRIIETPHRAQIAAMIMLFAGLRRGELLALTWDDINLDTGIISINKAVELVNNQPKVKPFTKTAAGMREILMPDILINYLKQHQGKGIVCPNRSGNIMSETSWRRLWSSYLNDLNIKYGDFSNVPIHIKSKFQPQKIPFVIEPFTAHCLRHTYASNLYMSGIDVLTAKELLGHTDIKTTLNIYTHLDNKYKIKEISKLNKFFHASQMQVK